MELSEYHWGHDFGGAATKVADWGVFVLAELTHSLDQPNKALADLALPFDVVVMRKAYVERYGDLVGMVARPALRERRVPYARRTTT